MEFIKSLLGESFREGMTLEDIDAALKAAGVVNPESLPKTVSKEVFDKTASELAKYKRELREIKESQMTAEEKLQAEIAKLKESQMAYARELATLRAKEIFLGAGLQETDYAPLLEIVVSEDEEITKSRAKTVVSLIEAQKKATEATVRTKLLGDTHRPPAGTQAQPGSLDKAIEAARESGDYVALASLLRQQQMATQVQK